MPPILSVLYWQLDRQQDTCQLDLGLLLLRLSVAVSGFLSWDTAWGASTSDPGAQRLTAVAATHPLPLWVSRRGNRQPAAPKFISELRWRASKWRPKGKQAMIRTQKLLLTPGFIRTEGATTWKVTALGSATYEGKKWPKLTKTDAIFIGALQIRFLIWVNLLFVTYSYVNIFGLLT